MSTLASLRNAASTSKRSLLPIHNARHFSGFQGPGSRGMGKDGGGKGEGGSHRTPKR